MSFDYKKIFFAFSLVIIQSSITFSQSGYELEFDGDDDYVETPGLLGEPANVTLAAWAKVASNQRGELISLGNHVAIRLNGTNKVAHRGFFRGTSTWHATGVDSTLAPGWHFFTYTNYDSSGTRIQKFYIDGNQVARTAVADAISYTGDGRNTRIGMHGSNNTYADFHGSIDDVGVWSKGLTSLEVKSLFNNGQIRGYHLDFGDYISKDKLLANWDFSEGVGSTLGANVTSAVWKPVAVKTIDSLKVMAFDTEGDRLYSVHPGTNSSADKAAVVSIVDLNTNEVIAQGGQFSMTEPGFNGYPKRIAVFDGIGVVGEGLMMFDFRGDTIKYMDTDLYFNSGTSQPKDAMHFQKFGDHLYVTLQSYGFAVFDMSNPEKPVLVHEKDYGISGAYPYGIHANEKHIFLSDITTDGGKIYIHKNGEDFSKVGEISTKAYRMATYGNLIYTDKKKVFDISDLANPVKLTGLNYSGESSNGEMYITGDFLLVSGGGHKGWSNPRASIYNIKNFSDITLAYTFDDTLPSYDMKIHEGRIYVAFGTQGTEVGGIKIFDNDFIPIEDVYVAMDGNNETGSGSYLSPFRTIKKALEVTSKVYKLSDKPKYTEFNSGDKKFTDNGDFSSSYVVSPTVWVKKGVYRIEKDISVSSADDQQFVQIHVIRSIDGADSTILKPAWKNYTTENGVNYSSEGFTAGTLGYLELHGFTIDSLNLNYINGEMIVYNSLVKYVKSSGRSGSAKYLGSTIFDTELGTNIQTHIHSSIILNPIKVGNNIRMANTLYDTSLSILTGYAFNVNKTWSEGWAQDNVAFKYGGKNDPQFCDNRTYRYYDTSVANRGEQFRNLKVGAGVGCDKPGDFHWLTERFNYVDITQENLSENLTLGWDESTSKFGDVHYELYARINIYPYELVDETSQTTLDISYQDILDNAFTENTPGSDVKVYFTVYAIDGPDTVQVGNSDRIAVVNRYGYLSIESLGIPDEFALHENYPNPFNPTTQIRFDIPEMSNVNLTIYNMLGQKVKVFNMESAPAGYHALTWNATNELGAPVSAGVYLYQLQTKGFVKTKKMVLLK